MKLSALQSYLTLLSAYMKLWDSSHHFIFRQIIGGLIAIGLIIRNDVLKVFGDIKDNQNNFSRVEN